MVNPNFPDIPVSDQRGFIYSPAKIRALLGGNRAMKTESGTIEALWYGLGIHPVRSELRQPPIQGRICAPKYEDGCKGVILKKFRSMIPHHNLKGSSWLRAWSEKSKILQLDTGSTYNFKSYEQDINTYGGDDLDFFWMDEHGEWKFMRENMARIVDRGGYGILTMTPEAGQTWEEDFLKNPPEGITTAYWFFDTRGNPFISKEGIETFMATLSDEKFFDAKIKGKFVALAGLVIPQFNHGFNIINDFEIPKQWPRSFIIDPHTRKPSAMMWLAWGDDDDCYVYRTIKRKETVEELARTIRAETGHEKIDLWIGDEALDGKGLNIWGEKSVLESFRDLGIPIQPAGKMQDESYFKNSVYKIQEMFTPDPVSRKPRLLIFKSCDYPLRSIGGKPDGSLPWELNRWSYKLETKADEQTFREQVRTVDDDYISCLRYGIMAGPFKRVHRGKPVEFNVKI